MQAKKTYAGLVGDRHAAEVFYRLGVGVDPLASTPYDGVEMTEGTRERREHSSWTLFSMRSVDLDEISWSARESSNRVKSESADMRERGLTMNNPMINDDEEMAEGSSGVETTARTVSHDLVIEGLRTFAQELEQRVNPPTLFDVIHFFGDECRNTITSQNKQKALEVLSEPQWGEKLRALDFKGEDEAKLTQQLCTGELPGYLAELSTCHLHRDRMDEVVLPLVMCEVAAGVAMPFEKELQAILTSSVDVVSSHRRPVKLNAVPIKRPKRVGAKVSKFRDEQPEEEWPFCKFVKDVLRASFICDRAEDVVRVRGNRCVERVRNRGPEE